jgi:long-chain fatty acid transport protein
MRKFTFLLLFMFITAMTVFAGGYQVGLHSQRSIGMGLIGTSLSYDASTLFFNPGGASFVNDRFSFSGGASFIMARCTFQGSDIAYQTHLKHEINTPFYLYGAFKPTKNLSVGIAVNTPYGNRLSWEDDWQGRFLIQNLSFHAITIQPTVGYKFGDILGIGAGLVIATGNVTLNKAIPLNSSTGEGSTNIKGSTTNVGFNVGVMVHPVKGLSIGVDYRSEIDMKVKSGDATFIVPPALQDSFPANKVNVTLPLPANLDFGLSYQINEKWMVGMNVCAVFWKVYDSLVFDFETTNSLVGRTATAALYKNAVIVRLGAQWKINNIVTVRAGGYYDPSPVQNDYLNPQTPSTNELGLTCGVSVFPFKGFSIDAAFLYLMGSKRTGTYSPENFAGTYFPTFYIPGIGLSYSF